MPPTLWSNSCEGNYLYLEQHLWLKIDGWNIRLIVQASKAELNAADQSLEQFLISFRDVSYTHLRFFPYINEIV